MRLKKTVFDFIAIVLIVATTAACVNFDFLKFGEQQSEPIVTKVVCPSIYDIPRDMQERALLEWATLEKLGLNTTIELLNQYGELREKIRACKAGQMK